MNLNEYQKHALSTDSYEHGDGVSSITDLGFLNKVLGLVGESGEFAEKIKKILRNNEGEMSEDERRLILLELGDVLWYVSTLSKYLGTDLETVAKMNIEKLADRKKRGVIKSQGDQR